ncbi:MAG: hypothetical protein PGN34_17405 [Methylobacterium frigidaeris]
MSRLARLGAAAALLLAGLGAAGAADFDGDGPPPPPRFEGRPDWRPPGPPRFSGPPEGCRVFVKRRYDPYGDEIVRRVRVCDDGPGDRWGPPRRRHWHPDGFDGPPRW